MEKTIKLVSYGIENVHALSYSIVDHIKKEYFVKVEHQHYSNINPFIQAVKKGEHSNAVLITSSSRGFNLLAHDKDRRLHIEDLKMPNKETLDKIIFRNAA